VSCPLVVQTEGANWKQSVMGEGNLPQMSSETIKGKVESAVGMVTGDSQKQNEGNIRVSPSRHSSK
jgi:hypothetical protein